jgi:hypothetical protein
MPQGHVFQRSLRVSTDDAGEAGNLLAGDRVPFVWHRRRALLPRRKELLRLADLRALQVTDLCGDLVERAAQHGQCADELGVAVAREHLGRDWRRLESELVQDGSLVLRRQVTEAADSPGKLADAHVVRRQVKALEVAAHLRVPAQQLHAEGGRFGVDTVRAADGGSVLEFDGAAL